MKSNLVTIVALLIATMIFGISNTAIAQKGQKPQKDAYFGITDLTDKQKADIDQIRSQNQKEVLPLREKMEEKQTQLDNLIVEEKVNMDLINKVIQELGDLNVKMMKVSVKYKMDIRKVLTKEQKAVFDENMTKGPKGKKNKEDRPPRK